mmetsp:Transcript_55468/g.101685  ORF Transcript_55468/g.101685 Transcript_55468/m.101685 type:complete len:91 (+) Transcript_55468:67-339(+)
MCHAALNFWPLMHIMDRKRRLQHQSLGCRVPPDVKIAVPSPRSVLVNVPPTVQPNCQCKQLQKIDLPNPILRKSKRPHALVGAAKQMLKT